MRTKLSFFIILLLIVLIPLNLIANNSKTLNEEKLKSLKNQFEKFIKFKEKHLSFSTKHQRPFNQEFKNTYDLFTAKQKLDTVKLVAQNFAQDYELRAILFNEGFGYFVDDSVDGKAASISYYFYSTSKGWFSINFTPEFIYLDTMMTEPPFVGGTVRLSEEFIDSDIVSDTAEANGGTEFRYEPGTVTTVFYELRNSPADDFFAPDTINAYWRVAYAKSDTSGEPLEYLIFYINSDLGYVVSKYKISFNAFFTAKEKFRMVDSLAKLYDNTSRLMYVLGFEDSKFDGRTFILSYGYLGNNDKKFSLNLFLGAVLMDTTSGEWILDDWDIYKEIDLMSYLDSDSLMSISELNGGKAFRDSFYTFAGGYIYVQSIFDSSKIYYHAIYNGTDNETGWDKNLFNLIDPVTGNFVSSILLKVDEPELIPNDFILYQNYPNPFNAQTKIKFYIPNSEFVTLKVYDILGREIVELVNEFLPAGAYEVVLDSRDLSSGVYFYTLKSNKSSLTKKMLLIK